MDYVLPFQHPVSSSSLSDSPARRLWEARGERTSTLSPRTQKIPPHAIPEAEPRANPKHSWVRCLSAVEVEKRRQSDPKELLLEQVHGT